MNSLHLSIIVPCYRSRRDEHEIVTDIELGGRNGSGKISVKFYGFECGGDEFDWAPFAKSLEAWITTETRKPTYNGFSLQLLEGIFHHYRQLRGLVGDEEGLALTETAGVQWHMN